MYVAKTKALISCAVTAQLICVFVFAYAKIRFSHNEAHLMVGGKLRIHVNSQEREREREREARERD